MDQLYPHRKTGQENEPDSTMRKTVRQKIIEKYLDLDSGLLDKLLSCGLLTWDEFDDIRATGSQRNKNKKLMTVILSKDLYQKFLDFLNETQYSHLVDYKSDSDYYRRLVRGDIPLTRREETILDMNRQVIVELLSDSSQDSSQLAEQLYVQGVLNDKQLTGIRSTSSNIQKSEMLVDMIRKRSVKDYQTTIRCLRTMHLKNDIADILEGGVTGRVKCHIRTGTESVDGDAIVSGLLKELGKRQYQQDGCDSQLSLLRLELSYVSWNNGIVLYFHFRSLEQLEELRTEFDNGSLRQSAENDLATLNTVEVKLTLDWPEYDFQRCKLYFSIAPSITVTDLPNEVLDMILQKSAQLLKLQKNAANDSTEVSAFFSLASVNNCWYQRISNPLLRKAVHRNLKAEDLKVKERSIILQNNREYLLSEIRPNELIPQLVQLRCLKRRRASSLSRLENDKEKNSQLLRIASRFSSRVHFRFVESLYLTNQINVARIVERGGVTVKMCIETETISNASAIEQVLVRELQKMLRENNDEKLWPHNLFNSLSIYDFVILNVQQGQEVIELWLWCQSQESLDRLCVANVVDLISITEQLFNGLLQTILTHAHRNADQNLCSVLSTPLKPKNVYINSDYFKYNVVVRRMTAILRGSLHIESDQAPSGATFLGGRLYITVGNEVIIYDAESPYRRLEKVIELPGMRRNDFMEVVACSVNEYLYINDPDSDCIWKVNPANNYAITRWLQNQEEVVKISTSSRGEVFVLDTNHSCPTVSIYNKDAVLQRTARIPLRTAGYSIRSAVVEILPEVVAVSFAFGVENEIREGIAAASLSGTGQVLREIEWKGLSNLTSHSFGRFIATEGNRLMLLDCQLNPRQVMCMSNEGGGRLMWPRILCYRRETKELIVEHVGYVDGYQLDVFKLSYDEE